MPVAFDNIPGNLRVPFFYAEFKPGGTPYQNNARLLLVGQKRSTGSSTVNEPIMVRDGIEVGLFGAGSMLAQMYRAARKQAPVQEIWALPVADLSGGTAATGKLTLANNTLDQAQPLSIYIGSERVRIPVLTSDTRATIASALVAEINANDMLPVTAAVNGTNNYEVDLTARHKGTLGNGILLDLGAIEVDGPAAATLVTVTAMASGAGDPDLQTALGNLGEDEFDWIAAPYADATNLGRATDLLNDTNGRWSWARQIYGHYITVHTGTVGALSTLGDGLNDQHLSIFPCRKFLSFPWEVAAAVGARVARHCQTAPELSRPLHSLALVGIKGPRLRADRLTLADRQTLYFDGISGYHVRRDGTVAIDRILTTYRTNAWGDADATYLDIETMGQSMFGIRYLRQKVTTAHGRQALADSNPGRLPHVATAADVRNTLVHGYEDLVRLGVFENPAVFARDVIVERDDTDANRLNASLPLDHVNQLRIFAAQAVNYMQRREPRDALDSVAA